MSEVHVPLLAGIDESVDAKILPAGGLTTLTNARFLKTARIGVRPGYHTLQNSIPADFAANYGPRFSLYFNYRLDATTPTTWWTREDNRNLSVDPMFTAIRAASCLGTFAAARRYATGRNVKAQIMASDVAYSGKYLVEVYQDADALASIPTTYGVTAVVRSALSHDVVSRHLLSSAARAPKAVALGLTTLAFFAQGDAVECNTFNASGTINGAVPIVVAVTQTGRDFAYDVAPYDGSTCLLVYQSGASTITWGFVDTAGNFTAVGSESFAGDVQLAISRVHNSTDVVVAWFSSSVADVFYEVFTAAGAGAGINIIAASGVGYPVLGPHTSYGWLLAWNELSGTVSGVVKTFAPGYAAPQQLGFMALASKPFVGPNDSCLMWCVSRAASADATTATYKLMDASSLAAGSVYGAVCEAVACQLVALPGYLQATTLWDDPRRFCVSSPSTLNVQQVAGDSFSWSTLLPVLARMGPGGYSLGQYGADLVRLDTGPFADTLRPAHLNGQLFLSGARLLEFDGSTLYESGLADGIEDFIAFGILSPPGVLPADSGTYLYTAIYTWVDDAGRKHRSAPCTPAPVVLGPFVAWTGATINYSIPAFSDRLSPDGSTVGICVEIYRTEADGSVFYLVNQDTPLPIGALDGTLRTYNDILVADAALVTHETLYTQGRAGGTSGLLPNDEPPPCRVVWGGNDRLIMGGLEDSSAVQWSKLVYPGEPVQFSQSDVYKAHIDGDVSAVACLDGVWFIASTEGWWVVQGEGPDDNGGGGFQTPRRLPSNVGCLSPHIVEIEDGLLFQGDTDKIYLMPRGGGAPVWMAEVVRSTLAAHPFITAARYVPEECLVYFACANSAGASVLLVYDTSVKQWMVDTLPADFSMQCLDVFDGAIVINGNISPVVGYDDIISPTSTDVSMVMTTGDVRPFGLQGRGRVRKLVVLGDKLSTWDSTLTIEVSYDSGQTWGELTTKTITGAAGDPFYVEHMIVTVRGTNYRFRLTVASVPPVPAYRIDHGVPLSATGINGDYWFDASNGAYWLKAAGSYTNLGSVGMGTSTPSDGSGSNGNYFVNTATQQILLKTAGHWNVISLSYDGGGGLIINAITVEHYPQTGTPRLANARRA